MNLLNLKIIKFNILTIYFLVILFLCGFIKVGIIIFVIVIVHELGHVFMALINHFSVSSVTIYPFGGLTIINKDINTSIKKELLIASGGFLFQIILFLIIFVIPISDGTKELFIRLNMSIMLFNMLPIIPLDGSIIASSILNKFFSYRTSYIINIFVSVIFLFLYLGFNYAYSLNNYLIVGLFVVKIFGSIKNFKYIYNKFLLERYLNDYDYKFLSTKKGDLGILKLDTFQYFKTDKDIVSEKTLLRNRFDKY